MSFVEDIRENQRIAEEVESEASPRRELGENDESFRFRIVLMRRYYLRHKLQLRPDQHITSAQLWA